MTTKTLEKYVRYSTLPYPTIIKRALKGGWSITDDKKTFNEAEGLWTREVTIKNGNSDTYSTCYPLTDDSHALYNIYGFDK